MEGEVNNTFRKKKKGRSFLQKAKRFGKQGQRGKGTEIDQDQYDYLVRVMERWRQGFDTEEERSIFVGNVMETTQGQERQLAGELIISQSTHWFRKSQFSTSLSFLPQQI